MCTITAGGNNMMLGIAVVSLLLGIVVAAPPPPCKFPLASHKNFSGIIMHFADIPFSEAQLKALEAILMDEPQRNSILNEKGFDFDALEKEERLGHKWDEKRSLWKNHPKDDEKLEHQEERHPWRFFEHEKHDPWGNESEELELDDSWESEDPADKKRHSSPRFKMAKRPFGSGSHMWGGARRFGSKPQEKKTHVEKRPFGNAVYKG
jgi:hypothetical protein